MGSKLIVAQAARRPADENRRAGVAPVVHEARCAVREYYRIINETVKAKLGGLHSAKSLMVTVDFAEIEKLQHEDRWDEAGQILVKCAQSLERGGADFIILCTNTMHKLVDHITANVNIPFLHIADATAQRVIDSGLHAVGLLGTRYTMEEDFYKGRLSDGYGLQVLVPDAQAREIVYWVIYDELVLRRIEPASKAQYLAIIEQLEQHGAQGVILGCTEIGLLVQQSDCRLPLFDTTRIHAAWRRRTL